MISQIRSKSKIISRVAGTFIVMSFVFFGMSSCKELPTPAEKVYLDTLRLKLIGNDKAMNISEDILILRKNTIRNEWIPSVQDTFPDIRGRMEDDFRGMLTAYDFYLNQYLLLSSGNQILRQDFEAFKAQVDEDKVDRKEFKEIYHAMNEKIDQLALGIEKAAKPVYDLEPMYMRYERIFQLRQKKTDPIEPVSK